MVDSVNRGNDITRTVRYHLDNVLTDPASPLVTIRNPLGVAVVVDATPTRLSAGIYQYTYSVALDALLGLWVSEFSGVLSGQSVGPTTTDYFNVLPVGAVSPVPNTSYTYDLSTSVGVVRLLIDDRDMSAIDSNLSLEQRSAIFADEEIEQFISLGGQDVLRAAAKALTTIAANKSLLVQSRRVGKAEIDYGSVRRDLLALAEAMIEQSNQQPADGYASQTWNDFSLRRLYEFQQMRDAGGGVSIL